MIMMEIENHRLELKRPFTISRGTITHQDTIVVKLHSEGFTGYGEVTSNDHYNQTVDSITQGVKSANTLVQSLPRVSPNQFWKMLSAELSENYFAISAIDIAYQDLWAKKQNQTCRQLWEIANQPNCKSSYTIAIDSIPTMVEKIQEEPGWPVYKIKLGTPNDIPIVQELRKHTDAVFRVDANCGWTASEAVEKSKILADLGVEFIEQPLPADALDTDKKFVFENSALPILADESCVRKSDVAFCQPYFHGINIKLCKCGGLTPALAMIEKAKSLGMKTMVGCMIETSIGISAAAQLTPLLDYVDLDGSYLTKNDPARGVVVSESGIELSESPGIGARLL